MAETERIDLRGPQHPRHPAVAKIAIGSAGAVAGALAVAIGPGLLTHGAAHPSAPSRHTWTSVCFHPNGAIGGQGYCEEKQERLAKEQERLDAFGRNGRPGP
jgi:hypothetical protein